MMRWSSQIVAGRQHSETKLFCCQPWMSSDELVCLFNDFGYHNDTTYNQKFETLQYRIVSTPWICLICFAHQTPILLPKVPPNQTKDRVTTRVRPVLSTVFFTRFTFGAEILSCTPSFFSSDLRPRCMRQSSVHPCPCQGFLKLLATQAPLESE